MSGTPDRLPFLAPASVVPSCCRGVLLVALVGSALSSDACGNTLVRWTPQGGSNSLVADANYDFGQSLISSIQQSANNVQNPIDDNAHWVGKPGPCADFSAPCADVSGDAGFTGDSFPLLLMGGGFFGTFEDFTWDSTGASSDEDNPDRVGLGAEIGGGVHFTDGSNLSLHFIKGGDYRIDGTSSLTLRGAGDPINGDDAANDIGEIRVILEEGAKLTLVNASFIGQGDEIYAADSEGKLVSYLSDTSILEIVGSTATARFPRIPGDFDGDGDVDVDDFGVFVNSFQLSPQGGPPFANGDFDEDGDVDVDDFGVFVNSFQSFPPPGVAAPEPGSAALLLVAAAFGLRVLRGRLGASR